MTGAALLIYTCKQRLSEHIFVEIWGLAWENNWCLHLSDIYRLCGYVSGTAEDIFFLNMSTQTVTFSLEVCKRKKKPSEDSGHAAVMKYLTAFHGVWQTLQLPVGDGHVVLAHGPVLEAPAFAVVVDQLGCFAGEEQGFLIVLLVRVDVGVGDGFDLRRRTLVTNCRTLIKPLNLKGTMAFLWLIIKLCRWLCAFNLSQRLPSAVYLIWLYHETAGHTSAFHKCFIAALPLKPIQPGKLQDYFYKSLMSRVLYAPPCQAGCPLCPCFHNDQLTIDRCPEVLSYLANGSATPARIASAWQNIQSVCSKVVILHLLRIGEIVDRHSIAEQVTRFGVRPRSVVCLKYLELDVDVSEAAADPALQHLVVIVVCVAQGFLIAFQGLLEDAQAQEGVAHAEAHLAVELQADGGALHVQAGLAVGHRLLEVAQLLVAARQVQVALGEVVRVLHLPGGVDLI